MNRIAIKSNAGLAGVVYPDYGGMLGKLSLYGRDILYLDEARLHEGAVLAGGNPVLFPCAGRTTGDRYELNGRSYRMPFHGLVRDSAFGVEAARSDSVTLVRTGCREWMSDCYPFDFELRLRYAIEGRLLRMSVLVKNNGAAPMPHAFGWHPYLVASDKARFELDANMSRCALYAEDGLREIPADAVDLTQRADYVYWGRTGAALRVRNPADGYALDMISDGAFGALVVCAKFDHTLCVEPWMGMPGALNTREGVKWVRPGEEARYDVRIEVRRLEDRGS